MPGTSSSTSGTPSSHPPTGDRRLAGGQGHKNSGAVSLLVLLNLLAGTLCDPCLATETDGSHLQCRQQGGAQAEPPKTRDCALVPALPPCPQPSAPSGGDKKPRPHVSGTAGMGENTLLRKRYNPHFVERPLLFQELDEAGDLPVELHNHPAEKPRAAQGGRYTGREPPEDHEAAAGTRDGATG